MRFGVDHFNWFGPTTQMLGRFQPWHRGHTELFKRAHSKTGQVVIMLRTMELDSDNPQQPQDLIMPITEALMTEGFLPMEDFTILIVPNITHITYGRDVGYTIEQEHLDPEIEAISATEIRNERNLR